MKTGGGGDRPFAPRAWAGDGTAAAAGRAYETSVGGPAIGGGPTTASREVRSRDRPVECTEPADERSAVWPPAKGAGAVNRPAASLGATRSCWASAASPCVEKNPTTATKANAANRARR